MSDYLLGAIRRMCCIHMMCVGSRLSEKLLIVCVKLYFGVCMCNSLFCFVPLITHTDHVLSSWQKLFKCFVAFISIASPIQIDVVKCG